MTKRDYFLLFILGFLAAWVPAIFQTSPGYMDADYYYLGGFNLASGAGFNEQVLWNYLDEPQGLPNPSHAYWMPFTSIVAALGILLAPGTHVFPVESFPFARLGFILLAGLIPPMTAWIATTLSGDRKDGWFAGLLAVFSGFYLSFLPTTDTFGIYMVLGALVLQFSWFNSKQPAGTGRSWLRYGLPLGLGMFAGAMHLARADGLIWLGVAILSPVFKYFMGKQAEPQSLTANSSRINLPVEMLLILVGYLAMMGPWIARNLTSFGSFLSPGGLRTLWLVQYDELFIYPPALLTFERWWASGLAGILQVRIAALGTNLGTALAVQGMIFLAPLGLLGLWHLRGDLRIRLGALAWLGTFLAMTLVFPGSGARGGFFHSGSATQILFWAAVPKGLRVLITWTGNKRGWRISQATSVFQVGLVILALGMTSLLVQKRVIGQPGSRVWDASANQYSVIHQTLLELGESGDEIVMVNNPPGYHLVSGQPAIVIPLGDVGTVLAAARQYGADYLVLEPNHPQPLNDLYKNPEGAAGLKYLLTIRESHIFSFE